MTERAARHVHRDEHHFAVGPSSVRWDGRSVAFSIAERGLPLLQRVRGTVRVWPRALSRWVTGLDTGCRHRWGPIAPCARVEVALQEPRLSWTGNGYFDSNDGDEPIERPFASWDWSRAALPDGSTAVIYDVRERSGAGRVLAERFGADGSQAAFDPPPRHVLRSTRWRIPRRLHSDGPVVVQQTLEDTPFYARSVLESGLFGQRVTSLHESLSVPRLTSLPVQLMLPWRMPRRR